MQVEIQGPVITGAICSHPKLLQTHTANLLILANTEMSLSIHVASTETIKFYTHCNKDVFFHFYVMMIYRCN